MEEICPTGLGHRMYKPSQGYGTRYILLVGGEGVWTENFNIFTDNFSMIRIFNQDNDESKLKAKIWKQTLIYFQLFFICALYYSKQQKKEQIIGGRQSVGFFVGIFTLAFHV